MQTQTPPWVLACSSGEDGQDFDTNDVPCLLWSVCKATELWCAKREEWPRLVLLILDTSRNDQGQRGLLRLCYIVFHRHCLSKSGQIYKDGLCPVCSQQRSYDTGVLTRLVSRSFPFQARRVRCTLVEGCRAWHLSNRTSHPLMVALGALRLHDRMIK